MNLLTLARSIRKTAEKEALRASKMAAQRGCTLDEERDISKQAFADTIEREFHKCEEIVDLAIRLKNMTIEKGLCPQNRLKDNMSDNNWWWITIRPPPNINLTFTRFKHWIDNNLLTNIDINKWMYAYEQKGESDETVGTGFHLHMIAHSLNYIQKKDMLAKLKTQGKILLNISHKNKYPSEYEAMIDVCKIATTTQYNNYVAYMSGDKKQNDKLYAVKYDDIFREKFSLQKLYTYNIEADLQDQ